MKTNKFHQICPRRLPSAPIDACPLGMEYVTQGNTDNSRDFGCQWGVASASHGYCFWTLIRSRSDEDGRMEPFSDTEICNLLGITQAVLDKTFSSAVSKLKAIKNTPDMQEFRELVLEVADRAPTDNTMYMPDNFRVKIPTVSEEDKAQEELPDDLLPPEKPRRKNRSMPLHRDGKKVDLYGITSKKKLRKK